MADDSVDCVVTSPPYNKRMQAAKEGNQIWKGFRIEYDCYRDDMSDAAYAEWMIKVLNEIYRVIKPAGSVFLNHKVILRDGLGHFPTWVFGSSLSLYQMIVWNRMCSSNMRSETLVLDCFSGSATTGVVAINNRRKYLGIELNQEYIKLSLDRIGKETAQMLLDI